jgi:hypothetical protein
MNLLLLIVLIILLVGALPTWPYSSGWGYYPSGGLGLILVILLVLLLLGRISSGRSGYANGVAPSDLRVRGNGATKPNCE